MSAPEDLASMTNHALFIELNLFGWDPYRGGCYWEREVRMAAIEDLLIERGAVPPRSLLPQPSGSWDIDDDE